jgi:propanediol dehydratase small subunit
VVVRDFTLRSRAGKTVEMSGLRISSGALGVEATVCREIVVNVNTELAV